MDTQNDSTAKIRVTVTDLGNGQSDTAEILNDYVIICAGTAEVTSISVSANGTHQLTVKGVTR